MNREHGPTQTIRRQREGTASYLLLTMSESDRRVSSISSIRFNSSGPFAKIRISDESLDRRRNTTTFPRYDRYSLDMSRMIHQMVASIYSTPVRNTPTLASLAREARALIGRETHVVRAVLGWCFFSFRFVETLRTNRFVGKLIGEWCW
jgi:hypothetical protein